MNSIRTMEIHAFGQNFGANDYAIVITRLEGVRVEIQQITTALWVFRPD